MPAQMTLDEIVHKFQIHKSFIHSYFNKETELRGKIVRSLQLNFKSKHLAQDFVEKFQFLQWQFQSLSCLPHYQKWQHLNEKIILKATWCIGKPQCKASVFYDNEVDPEQAVNYLNGRVIDGNKVVAKISKNNKKKLDFTNLNIATDEETLKMYLNGFFSKPKIVVHREEVKENMSFAEQQLNGMGFVNQFNESFEQLLLSHSLGSLIDRMTIEYSSNKQLRVHAIIMLQSEEEGQALVNKYDGKTGIIGTQKLRVQIKSKFIVKFSDSKIGQILSTELNEQKMLILARNGNTSMIDIKQDAIIIQGIDRLENRKVASQFDKLCQGKTMFVEKVILDKHYQQIKDVIDHTNNHYHCQAVYAKRADPNHIQIVARNEQIHNYVEQTIQQLVANIKKAFKQSKVKKQFKPNKFGDTNTKTCGVCFDEVSSYFEFECKHTFCAECLHRQIDAITQKYQINCPEFGCKTCISLNNIKELYQDNSQFQNLCQGAIKSYISAQGARIKNCQTPNCPQIYEWKPDITQFECKVCYETWCVQGKVDKTHKPHSGQTCQEAIAEKKDVGIEELIKKGDVKKCPFCQTPIFRDQGCRHMTCTQCRGHFCWICGKGFEGAQQTYDHLAKDCGGIYDAGQ